MLAKVGVMLVKSIVTTFALSNYLNSGQFGILNYPMTIVTFSTAIAALGLDGFITRELLSSPQKSNTYLGTAFIMRVMAGLVTLPLVYLAYHVIDANSVKPLQTPFRYVFIVAFVAIVQSVNIIDSFFQSKIQGKYIMYVQLTGNILSTLTKLIFILLKLPLVWFVYSLLLDAVFVAVSYIFIYQSKGNNIFQWRFDKGVAIHLLKHSWPLAFSAVLGTIYMKIDQGMIGSYLNIDQLGIYSNVANLSESYYFIPVTVVTSVFPAIMHARNTDKDRYYKRLQNLYDLMVVLSLGAAIILSFGSTFIFHSFLKKEYWPGAPVLSVYVWAGVFSFLGTASGQYLIAEGYTRLAMVRTGAGAIVNIVLNIFWIPKYGIIGAAYATLIAYAVAAFFILFIPKTRGQGVQMLKSLFLFSLFQKAFNR